MSKRQEHKHAADAVKVRLLDAVHDLIAPVLDEQWAKIEPPKSGPEWLAFCLAQYQPGAYAFCGDVETRPVQIVAPWQMAIHVIGDEGSESLDRLRDRYGLLPFETWPRSHGFDEALYYLWKPRDVAIVPALADYPGLVFISTPGDGSGGDKVAVVPAVGTCGLEWSDHHPQLNGDPVHCPPALLDLIKAPPVSQAYTETKLPALLDHAESCLIHQGAPLYQMGGRLVHPVRSDKDSADDESIRRKAGSLTIGDVNQHRLREYVIDKVPFHKVAKGGGGATKYAAPMAFSAHLLARGDRWRFPNLKGVIETPTLRRDGSILACDGFDSKSGLLLDMGGVRYPTIPDEPTRAEALAALAILKEPFAGFPFVANAKGDSASRSVMLSAVLTALVRRTLHSAPMHGTSAPTMGTGKTLAIDVVSLVATGRLTTAMSQGANEEEDEKRLFSVLLQNDLILLIDNVKRPIEGDALCTVLTQSTWQSRILGESRKVEVPTNALMMASGNNLTFKGDMTTRSILCRMDAKVEKPETRRFAIDLKSWVPQHRVELVAAGLTVLRAFVVAGRPGLDKVTPFGRFEDWSNLVRGALIWLGEPDPCKTRAFIATDDPEHNDLGQLLAAMKDNMGDDDEATAGELIKLATDCSDDVLLDAILNAVPKATGRTLGGYLHSRHGRILEGLRLDGRYDKRGKVWRYQVRKV